MIKHNSLHLAHSFPRPTLTEKINIRSYFRPKCRLLFIYYHYHCYYYYCYYNYNYVVSCLHTVCYHTFMRFVQLLLYMNITLTIMQTSSYGHFNTKDLLLRCKNNTV